MKKIIVLIYLFINSIPFAFCQVDTTQYLIDLRIRAMVNERKNLYSQYSQQIEKKSGFFGNQTKNDIRKANEILLKILNTDTRIFEELEEMIKAQDREMQKRKYEKQDKEYTIIKKDEEVQTHAETVAKLQRNVENLQTKEAELKKSRNTYRFLFFTSLLFLLLCLGGIFFVFYRRFYSS